MTMTTAVLLAVAAVVAAAGMIEAAVIADATMQMGVPVVLRRFRVYWN